MKKDLLKKVKMPAAKMAEEEAALDLEALGGEGEEAPEEEMGELAKIPDEILIEEMKKRGLIEDLAAPEMPEEEAEIPEEEI